MVRRVTLRRMGESIGVTLPREIAQHLNLAAGDELLAVETANGILLTLRDPNVDDGLAIAVEAQLRYRRALRELAKRPSKRRG